MLMEVALCNAQNSLALRTSSQHLACTSGTPSCATLRTLAQRCAMADPKDASVIRQLGLEDYDKGFLGLLAQLTTVGDVTLEEYTRRWQELHDNPDYHIAVAEDSGKLVGTAALLIERKFIHNCGKVGHIEDVVVDEVARGQQLGQRLIEELISVAKQCGCYKVILDCSEHNVPFYEKCGFRRKEAQMAKYLDR